MSNSKKINLFKVCKVKFIEEKPKKTDAELRALAVEAYKNTRTVVDVLGRLPFNSKSPAINTSRSELIREVGAYRKQAKDTLAKKTTCKVTVGRNSRSFSYIGMMPNRDILKNIRTRVSEIFSERKLAKEVMERNGRTYHLRPATPQLLQARDINYGYQGKACQNMRVQVMGNSSVGYVHVNNGDIIRLKDAQRIRKIFEAKSPKTQEHHVGVEIEFFAPVNSDILAEHLVSINEYLCLKTDGSIRAESGHHGHELTICVPESKRAEVITKVCAVLREVRAKVNSSCGLHVHLDMRNRDRYTAFNNLVAAQTILYAMQPSSRRSNRFCRKVEHDFDAGLRADSKYWGVNSQSYQRLKTIEVRLHAGTTDATKINNFVDILCHVVSKSTTVTSTPKKANTFGKAFDLPDTLVAYIDERIAKFEASDSDDPEMRPRPDSSTQAQI